jgi:tetratricopeptide (TPR) repeat protein
MVYIFIFLLFRKKELALLVGLIYAVHPIHTEAVTYISGRADSQAAFFILLCLCLYIRYTQSSNSKDILVYFGSFLSFILALMSKEMATMLPAYLLLTDLVTFKDQKKTSWKNIVLRYLPMLAVLGIYLHLRATVLDFANIPLLKEQPARQIPIFFRFLTFTKSLLGFFYNDATRNVDFGYLWLLLLPFNLHMERGTPYVKKIEDWTYIICFIGFLALIAATIFLYRKSKIRFFGLSFFLVAFFPFMDFIPLNANMAEHWLYMPAIGVLLFVSDVCVSLLKLKPHHSLQDVLKKIIFSPISIYLIYCGILTVIRNLDWKDEFTIWKETARLSNSSHIHGNLGVAYGRRGDIQSSKQEFIKALRLQFNYPEAHNNLGVILLMEGKLEEAKKEFEYAIQFNPNYSNAYKNLGDVYLKTGKPIEAKQMWQKALEINPYHAEAKKRLQENP